MQREINFENIYVQDDYPVQVDLLKFVKFNKRNLAVDPITCRLYFTDETHILTVSTDSQHLKEGMMPELLTSLNPRELKITKHKINSVQIHENHLYCIRS